LYVNSIRIEKTPGKKTYTFHYMYNDVNMKWEGVREQYVMDLVHKINKNK
jgi:hypothetical protein